MTAVGGGAFEDWSRHSESRPVQVAVLLLLTLAGCGGSQSGSAPPPKEVSPSTPIWSLETARILFTGSRNGSSDLHILDRASGETHRLTDLGTSEGGANAGRVSPDGATVAFKVRRGSDYDIYVMALVGGVPENVVDLVSTPEDEREGEWIQAPR